MQDDQTSNSWAVYPRLGRPGKHGVRGQSDVALQRSISDKYGMNYIRLIHLLAWEVVEDAEEASSK
jgi:hypothetical protein